MPSRRFALFRANRLERSPEVSKMSEMEIEEFARIVAKLIRNSAEVRQAVWDCACLRATRILPELRHIARGV